MKGGGEGLACIATFAVPSRKEEEGSQKEEEGRRKVALPVHDFRCFVTIHLARSFQKEGGSARCTAAERLYGSSPPLVPAPVQYDTWYFLCGDHVRVSTGDVVWGGDIHNPP